jgi:hypothetical protein
MAYYYKSPLTAVLEGLSSGLTTGLTQAGVDWWRSRLEEKNQNRKIGLGSILQSMIGASPEEQELMAAEAKNKFRYDVPMIEKPLYSTAEGLGITPVPGALSSGMVQKTGSTRQRLLPALDQERWLSSQLQRMPQELQSKAALAKLAPHLVPPATTELQQQNIVESQRRFGPGGLEEQKLAEEKRKADQDAALRQKGIDVQSRQVDAAFKQIDVTQDWHQASTAATIYGHQLDYAAKVAKDPLEREQIRLKALELAEKVASGMGGGGGQKRPPGAVLMKVFKGIYDSAINTANSIGRGTPTTSTLPAAPAAKPPVTKPPAAPAGPATKSQVSPSLIPKGGLEQWTHPTTGQKYADGSVIVADNGKKSQVIKTPHGWTIREVE